MSFSISQATRLAQCPTVVLLHSSASSARHDSRSSGDFAVIGTTLQIVGESLAEAADVRAGEQVLDVADGNGNATLAAARRFAQVTSTDYVPALWGTESHIVELFGTRAAAIRCNRRHFNFRYRSAAHWVQVFRDFYGPTHKAFAALDATGQRALEHDIIALLEQMNTAGAASLVVPSEYLEIVITKYPGAAD